MTYEELEQSLDKYGTYHYKDVLEAHESGEYNAIDRMLGIIDERISLLDREHEGDHLVVVRCVLQDLRDEFDRLRGEEQ